MIEKVDINSVSVSEAALVHSVSWKESHRSFCTTEFVEAHSPENQKVYFENKIANGASVYILRKDDGKTIAVVSVDGDLIGDLYVLPEYRCMGYGTKLLDFAISVCTGTPRLYVLSSNKRAEKLYLKRGFMRNGKVLKLSDTLDEYEYELSDSEK